ncbi:hypothetical protein PZ61_0219690 [Streptomyces sp. MNU77]|uniref:hypothetical protein n=1 Tax=Streptomyces sp. MNU77 TaxID=1573406 RepID=UPI0005E9AB27|nr:hypothetical protein [Streptomyces sp. MNU77]OLO32510.1 hypothetical protein PZ61_0219690 [Streptomyces sp. MNU77]
MTNQALAAVSDVPASENAATVPAQAPPPALPAGSAAEAGPGPWKRPGYTWRWPSVLEVSRCASGLTLAAAASGFVPDGSPTVVAGVVIAVHSVVELVAVCFRRTRR